MPEKAVSLGSRLHYPITVTKLLKSAGDAIRKQDKLFVYKYNWRRKVGDDSWNDESAYVEFASPAEGRLKEWRIREGMVISADVPCMVVEEACSHEVQLHRLCCLCGADMTETTWASEERDTDRATINMTHDQTGLMVSQEVATKAENETQKRLLRQRKLSLVVDLDQTIIHACIEPTIGEWQRDATSPNHEAVRDVKSFQLNDDGPRGLASGCTYYIKLRPGLRQFLDEVSRMYEMHVYTMGTRAYARNITRIVDPDRYLFANRVISRDENGSITSKSLQRIFPVSTNMVVIIDDRADVWPRNRPNLIKVIPYDFFKGIGDINSSFLPRRVDVPPTPSPTPSPQQRNGALQPDPVPGPAPAATADEGTDQPKTIAASTALEEIADDLNLKMQTEEQEKTLERQLTDRPLLHMQEELDREGELSAAASQDDPGDPAAPAAGVGHGRQHLLSDDDEELSALQDHLTDLHTSFYETYDRRRKERRQSDPTLPPGSSAGSGSSAGRRRSVADDGVDLSMVPDVGDILDELKSSVLSGLVIVLSGLVPLGVMVEESEIGMQAQSFGAQVLDTITRRVTHLVVSTSRPRTKKVQQAAKMTGIKIVNQNWLTDCLSQWRRLDERPYYLEIQDIDREKSSDTAEPSDLDKDNKGDEAAAAEAAATVDEARELKGFDWATADKDLEEFLGDEDDDDEDDDDDNDEDDSDESSPAKEDESTSGDTDGSTEGEKPQSSSSVTNKGKRKKAQAGDDTDEDTPEVTTATSSVMAKKQRLSRSRGTSTLRSVQTPNGADTDLDDEALERELLAELEAAGE